MGPAGPILHRFANIGLKKLKNGRSAGDSFSLVVAVVVVIFAIAAIVAARPVVGIMMAGVAGLPDHLPALLFAITADFGALGHVLVIGELLAVLAACRAGVGAGLTDDFAEGTAA